MWLERRSSRRILRPQLRAPLSAHDTHARKSQRLPAVLSTGHSSTGRRGADLPLEPQSAAQANQMHGPTLTKRTNSGKDAVDQEALHRPPVRAADATVLAIVPSDIRRAAALPVLFAGGSNWVPSRQLLEVSAPTEAAVSPDEGMDGSGEVFLQRNSAPGSSGGRPFQMPRISRASSSMATRKASCSLDIWPFSNVMSWLM